MPSLLASLLLFLLRVARTALLTSAAGAAAWLAYVATLRARVDRLFPGPAANVLVGNLLSGNDKGGLLKALRGCVASFPANNFTFD